MVRSDGYARARNGCSLVRSTSSISARTSRMMSVSLKNRQRDGRQGDVAASPLAVSSPELHQPICMTFALANWLGKPSQRDGKHRDQQDAG